MLERFTDRARRTVVLARDAARARNHNYIGPEHLLIGLLSESRLHPADSPSFPCRYLELKGIDLAAISREIDERVGLGGEPRPDEHIPFSPRLKNVLKLALREALNAGHHYIDTRHLLIGLVREDRGVAASALKAKGVELRSCRHALLGVNRARTHLREVGLPSEQVSKAQTDE